MSSSVGRHMVAPIHGAGSENKIQTNNIFRKISTGRPLPDRKSEPEHFLALYNEAIDAIERNDSEKLAPIIEESRTHTKRWNKNTLGSLLFKCCEFDDANLNLINDLISVGANVNFTEPEQNSTSLMMAAKSNNEPLLRTLIDSGARVNSCDKFGWTALFYASYFGSTDCAAVLLANLALINLADYDKMNCLIWAAGRGHLEVVKLLLGNGANVNARDSYNSSALLWACRNGHTQIAETLLVHGARVNDRGMYGWTSLLVSVKRNHLETTRLLLKQPLCNPNICDPEKMSPLLIACRENYKEIALELIRAGSCVNQPDKNGNTPLIYAAMNAQSELVEALLNAGAYAEYLGENGRNAIHWSVIRGDEKSLSYFLALDIDLHVKTPAGETYLALALLNKHTAIGKLLMEQAAKRETSICNANAGADKNSGAGSMETIAPPITCGTPPIVVVDDDRLVETFNAGEHIRCDARLWPMTQAPKPRLSLTQQLGA